MGGWLARIWVAVVLLATPALGQPVLVLDQEALFARTAWGRQIAARFEAARAALVAENERLAAALEDEERALTERRASLPPDEFRALAAAFDEKVTRTRSEQAAKAGELTTRFEAERATFFAAIGPVVEQLAAARGASVVLDRRLALIVTAAADLTDAAIAAIDARFGDGPAPEAGAGAEGGGAGSAGEAGQDRGAATDQGAGTAATQAAPDGTGGQP